MEKLYNFISVHQVLNFVIAFFLFLCLIAISFRLLFKDQFNETMNSLKDHICQDYDDEPYNRKF